MRTMNKQRYSWWDCIKSIIRAYPGGMGADLSGVTRREREAVQAAIEATERMSSGTHRMKIIRLVHFERTHNLPEAARAVPCSERAAFYWQRQFFEMTARNLGMLD